MILVDTSVLVDYLRSPSTRILRSFEQWEAAICGVTRAEILAGARNPADVEKIARCLNVFSHVPVTETLWDRLGTNLSLLRSTGTVVPFADALIATIAIERDIELWTCDLHFTRIQQVLHRLRLFREPTA
jgi:predicted nucleic acid-binding protein